MSELYKSEEHKTIENTKTKHKNYNGITVLAASLLRFTKSFKKVKYWILKIIFSNNLVKYLEI